MQDPRAAAATPTTPTTPNHAGRAALTLGALGVVYGDIGTSPLYTMKEVFNPAHALAPTTDHLIGAISLIVTGLLFVVTLKYVVLILRADNRGEGGIIALTALATKATRRNPALRLALLFIGIIGAALFYGDSIITPAISVLSAVEGLELVTPALKPYVLPITLGILVALFALQRFGTELVGRLFGPVIGIWFVVLAVAGAVQIIQQPAILAALNPLRGLEFARQQGGQVFVLLGAVVLAFTGAEALYADMGHFGKRPIRLAWTGLVLPSLALNYLGQGALLMRDPTALANPFYHLFSADLLLPALVIATAATVIASQAVITGAFSLTQQAIQLGLLPRMRTIYTSASTAGQIYIPLVNGSLLAAVVLAVATFGSSSELAAAYGIAVTITMTTTTVLTYFVVRHAWRLPAWLATTATLAFLSVDLLLVAACLFKFADGGWFPIVIGLALVAIMTSWRRGRELLMQSIRQDDPELMPFLQTLLQEPLPRAHRTAVYAVADPDTVPQALLHNLKHNQVLHERNLILTVVFHDSPTLPESQRIQVQALAAGFWKVTVNYGFKESPDIPKALSRADALRINPFETTYFLSRETLVRTRRSGMAPWRERLFALMARNAGDVADFLRLPSNCVIELGTRVQL